MTTPGGVPNLPTGALTIGTLQSKLHDMSGTAMKSRAVERFPSIFDSSTGLSAASAITPFGILTSIWSEVNSLIANANPADVQGPNDIPNLVVKFISELPAQFVDQFIGLFDAITGGYLGSNPLLLQFKSFFGGAGTGGGVFGPLINSVLGGTSNPLSAFTSFLSPTGALAGGGIFGPLLGLGGGLGNLNGLLGFLGPAAGLGSGAGIFAPLLSGGSIFTSLIPGLDASKITGGTFGAGLLQPLIDAISGGFGGGTGLGFGGLTSLLNAIPGVGPLINTFVGQFLGLTGGSYGIPDLTRAIQSIPTSFLAGALSPGQASHLTIGTLSSVPQQFLTNPNLDTANSVIGQGAWTWDGTQGPGGGVLTSVYTDATGVLKELFSNTIPVAPGQVLNVFGSTKWTGFTGGANSISLTVQEFTNGIIQSTSTIGSIASPGTAGGWTLLSNPTYTVPAGIDSIFLRPIVTSGATAGRVSFGKLSVMSTATNLLTSLVPLLDTSKIGTGTFGLPFLPSVQTLTDNIFQAVNGGSSTGNALSTVKTSLQAIPSTNVGGFGGLSDIGASGQAVLDYVWSGLSKTTGTGKSFADVSNIASTTVTTAQNARTTGDTNSAVLAIRNNTPFSIGLHQTEVGTFPLGVLPGATDPPNFAVTSTTTPISFWNAPDSAKRGFVTWYGKGITNVTAIYIDLYKLSTDGTSLNFVQSSGNLLGIMGAGWTNGIWIMSGAAQVDTLAGDTFAFAMRTTGTGTHTVAGIASTWLPTHALASSMTTPQKVAAVRTDGAYSNITMSGITYSGNQAWFGFGINDGSITPPAFQPVTQQFTTSGTWTAPYWYDPAVHYLDLISVGGGSGGSGGFSNYSTPGGNSVVTIGGVTKQTATGGAAAAPNSGPGTGYGPGNQIYLGTTYVGGVDVSSTYNGSPPGGGGGSGNYFGVVSHGGNAGIWATTTVNPGTSSGTVSATVGGGGAAAPAAYGPGNGAPGAVWIVARAV